MKTEETNLLREIKLLEKQLNKIWIRIESLTWLHIKSLTSLWVDDEAIFKKDLEMDKLTNEYEAKSNKLTELALKLNKIYKEKENGKA